MKTFLSKIRKNDNQVKVIKLSDETKIKEDSISPILIPSLYRNSNKMKTMDSAASEKSPLMMPSLYTHVPLNELPNKKKHHTSMYPEAIKQLHSIKLNLEAQIKEKDEMIGRLEERLKNNDIQMLLSMLNEKDKAIDAANKEKSCLEHKFMAVSNLVAERDKVITTLHMAINELTQENNHLKRELALKDLHVHYNSSSLVLLC